MKAADAAPARKSRRGLAAIAGIGLLTVLAGGFWLFQKSTGQGESNKVPPTAVADSLTSDEFAEALAPKQGAGYHFNAEPPKRVIAQATVNGVQLWENGPYWAECNVGATKPEECGYYFWWGDTVGYKRVGNSWIAVDGSRTDFKFSAENCPTRGKDNSTLRSLGYIDSTGNLTAVHDAATAHLGTPWRMPTAQELNGLCQNCTTKWTTRDGIYGRLVTGRGAFSTKSIFLPAAGLGYGSSLNRFGSYGGYGSSTPDPGGSLNAWYLYFHSGNLYRGGLSRYDGRSVRPVRGSAK